MNEGRKLHGEILEEAPDGAGGAVEWTYEEWTFICNNCIGCQREGPQTCPYGTDKHAAFRLAGGGETCPRRVEPATAEE